MTDKPDTPFPYSPWNAPPLPPPEPLRRVGNITPEGRAFIRRMQIEESFMRIKDNPLPDLPLVATHKIKP